MAYRTRINYTYQQLDDIWNRWERGETLNAIGRVFDRPSSSIFNLLSPTGGIRPKPRKRSPQSLTLSEREEISRGIVAEKPIRQIAFELNRSPSTISREISRNSGQINYRAAQADGAAWQRANRPKRCKLGCYPALARIVAGKLKGNWSPWPALVESADREQYRRNRKHNNHLSLV